MIVFLLSGHAALYVESLLAQRSDCYCENTGLLLFFTLSFDGRDDVVGLQVDLEPVARLVSGLLARTPRSSVPLHTHSAPDTNTTTEKKKKKEKKKKFVMDDLFIYGCRYLSAYGVIESSSSHITVSWRAKNSFRFSDGRLHDT